MSNVIGRLLAKLIWSIVPPKREPDFLIGPSEADTYMRRWFVIPRNKIFNIYLHHMLHDDDDRAPHDHPWWSLSLCLEGWIDEHEMINEKKDPRLSLAVYDGAGRPWTRNQIRQGDFKWRGKEYAHLLKLPEGEAWTLFITGPKVRVWGFHCPKGWIPWHQFVDPVDNGKSGPGCGEME